MPNSVQIREARLDDLEQWRVLWDAYNAFYGRTGETAVPGHITNLTWQRCLDAQTPVHAVVAEQAGELMGFAHYLFHVSTISAVPACYLRDLYTSSGARGRGVATALVRHVCNRAKLAGSTSVYWHTHETNEVARQLYDTLAVRSGFIIYQRSI